ncbi:MAG: TIGR00300 family protein [Cyanobacteriota bacterium]|nr:TIGR00300 family protein [Cyanobacteriota bacterium]
MTSPIQYLMCPPHHYDVDYVINPWMVGNIHRSSKERAEGQWKNLYTILSSQADVQLVEPAQGWPDMVFTANAGLILNQTVVLSRFYHPERQGEQPFFKAWFEAQGYTVYELPPELAFEGAGDALLDRAGRWLWAGYGFRSMLESHPYLAKWLEIEVLSLRLVDERFYHLDTCFCPLSNGYLLYYPAAFDTYSNRLIELRVPAEKRIPIDEADAINFACNAVDVNGTIVVNRVSPELQALLEAKGFRVVATELTEFLKAGGAAKCLTLRVTETIAPQTDPVATVFSRTVILSGHLVDSNILNDAIDLIVENGGSFQIVKFTLGEKRQSTSSIELSISAPTEDMLATILSALIERGAILPDQSQQDVHLEVAQKTGVAPDDFYVTTIYPTQVRVNGQWVDVQGQRMDGAIVVSTDPEGKSQARCALMRDIVANQQVVVGVEGIRTLRQPTKERSHEFSFMGAGVSSERRVELQVEQIAWELRQIKERGGKTVVVAGPVVIHTGGGSHLATLIREGYVQALLGGNAIAVHDLEQNVYGTSLGVDMHRGSAVKGGHRHHLKTINMVRNYGSIRAAVEAGSITGGVFYECIHHQVPFALAGSIRDDGPLPDTEMNLIQAQADYARLIAGSDMVLMLSSMLHSIGVGNMTPAGVKLICVDINPAVVTKLADRGSLESVGIVTDVGLFLSLLVQQLHRLVGRYEGLSETPLAATPVL